MSDIAFFEREQVERVVAHLCMYNTQQHNNNEDGPGRGWMMKVK
jgi:hypothetical protein